MVVEIKRDTDGGHMELQALRYAAMVSAMTFDHAVSTLAAHRNAAAPDQDSARADILNFLGWDEPQEDGFALSTRIILVAADFSREITTTVLWLRDHEVDVQCVRLKLYKMEGERLLVDIQPLIPLPEAEEYQTRLGDKRQAERKERTERHDVSARFLEMLYAQLQSRGQVCPWRLAVPNRKIYGATGRGGFWFNFVGGRERSRVEFLIDADNAREQLHRLLQHRQAIEANFGKGLEKLEKEGTRQCRIYHSVEGGYGSPDTEWPRIHDALIEAMVRLDAALRPQVARLA